MEHKHKSLTFTVEDLMKMLNIGRNSAYELVRSGEIRSVKIGRCYRIPLSALVEYLEGTHTA